MAERVTVWVQRFEGRKYLALQWHDPETGRRKTQSTKTDDQGLAEEMRGDKEYELNHGLAAGADPTTWGAFREKFEAEYVAGVRENTRKNFAATLDHFERICRPARVDRVTARTVSEFLAGLRKVPGRGADKSAKPVTLKSRLVNLRTALSWAQRQGYLAEVPAFPGVKVPDRKPLPVPEGDVNRLLAACGDDRHLRAYLLCAWLAGLRRNEAYHLRRGPSESFPWLDLPAEKIRLPAEFVKAAADQWVPLDPGLREALLALPENEGGRVFAFVARRYNKGSPVTPQEVGGRVKRLAEEAGLRMTYKTLRRGFGCRYAATVPAQVLQKLMRHSSIAITMKYYANVDDAVMEAVLGKGGGG